VATVPASELTSNCGASEVLTPVGYVVVTEKYTENPQQGLTPASYSETAAGWNPVTGARLWSHAIVPAANYDFGCGTQSPTHEVGDMRATADGHWGAFLSVGASSQTVIDLASGKAYQHTGNSDVVGVIGNYVATEAANPSGQHDPATLTLVEPGSWKPLGYAKSMGLGRYDVLDDMLSAIPGLAPAGMVHQKTAGAFGDAAITPPGGDTLIVNDVVGTTDPVKAFTLPAFKLLWTNTAGNSVVGGNASVVLTEPGDGGSLSGLSMATGQTVWTIRSADASACDISPHQVDVDVHGQTAVLDLATGKQLSYRNSDCQAP
jgi:hypothetical protein